MGMHRCQVWCPRQCQCRSDASSNPVRVTQDRLAIHPTSQPVHVRSPVMVTVCPFPVQEVQRLWPASQVLRNKAVRKAPVEAGVVKGDVEMTHRTLDREANKAKIRSLSFLSEITARMLHSPLREYSMSQVTSTQKEMGGQKVQIIQLFYRL